MKKKCGILLLLCMPVVVFSQFNTSTRYLPRTNKATLADMREQQKLARDVYCALDGRWNLPVFHNTSEAEENHMDAVKGLLDQFEVEDPVAQTSDVRGRFVDDQYQRLYDSLVITGTASMEGAFRAGAYVEERDISELQRAVSLTASEDLRVVYKYLMVAAERHLLAFARNLKKLGVRYQPVLLQRMDYDRIVGASGGSTSESSVQR